MRQHGNLRKRHPSLEKSVSRSRDIISSYRAFPLNAGAIFPSAFWTHRLSQAIQRLSFPMQHCTSSGCLLRKCTWRGCVPYAGGSKAITAIPRRLCITTSRGRIFRKSKRQRLCKRRKRYWTRARSFPIAPLPTYTIPILCRRYSPKRTPPWIPLWISSTGKQPSPMMPPVWLFCSSCMGRRRRDCLQGRGNGGGGRIGMILYK